jgi:hypothetical protein
MNRQVALLWGAVAVALVGLSPLAPDVAGGLWPCAFKSLTGIACPTCGTTRAALALARLDVLGALTRYPLPALGWMAFVTGGLAAGLLALCGRTPPAIPRSLPLWARVGLLAVVLANWAYSIATGV